MGSLLSSSRWPLTCSPSPSLRGAIRGPSGERREAHGKRMGCAHESRACRRRSSRSHGEVRSIATGLKRGRPLVSHPTASSGGLLVRTELLCPRISDSRPAALGSSVLHLSRARGSKEGKGIVSNNAHDRQAHACRDCSGGHGLRWPGIRSHAERECCRCFQRLLRWEWHRREWIEGRRG